MKRLRRILCGPLYLFDLVFGPALERWNGLRAARARRRAINREVRREFRVLQGGKRS